MTTQTATHTTVRTFRPEVIPADIRAKMARAAANARRMAMRTLRCPHCKFRVGAVYPDTGGHVEMKCQKCKTAVVFKFTPGTDLDFRIARN